MKALLLASTAALLVVFVLSLHVGERALPYLAALFLFSFAALMGYTIWWLLRAGERERERVVSQKGRAA